MIYPSETGKAGELVRLRTLESVWIQGKLRMWGRWSAINMNPAASDMFKKLLSKYVITQNDLSKALKVLRKRGCSSIELESWVNDMLQQSRHSSLVFCTDDEGLLMDRVIARIMKNNQGLLHVLEHRYQEKMSLRGMARELNDVYPELSVMTCRRRVDMWLGMAESMLYKPMCDAFETNSERFYLKVEPIAG
ncbi:DUF1133 domain-containing protein [Prodigiosinella confusarubida]|uniref:DUF1133 domain-containing protein n=1 Tax=Serratia sp. (strain ATCC 39006) TaxID=104623 RepID=A0A2I5TKV6_SERS3|nr:DUF1133 family protein [Serratia sp. ATCC 39006]AUH00878.1 DUF1133 domain-containing protein [Serratia sp. ATCC 39006]AUH05200.1 DUF1133 domain-containing protein [Serratia sp. ATCC 39006]